MKLAYWIGKESPWYVRILRTTLVGYLVALIVLILRESSIVYPATKAQSRWQPPSGFEDVWFESNDGTRINGWYYEVREPRGHLLFCHGNGGNLKGRAGILKQIAKSCHVCVFAIDYRGYGQSDGSPSEKGVVADSQAAAKWLAKRAKVEPGELIVMGRSLGGAVAVQVAAENQPRALILESTFSSLPDAALARFPVFRIFPVEWMMRNQFRSGSHIQNYSGPVLQSHGIDDDVVAFRLGKDLHQLIPGEKQFIEIADRGHNDPQPLSYYGELERFLDKVLGSETD